ncbi:MAG: gamma-glutamylcyclotransferase [Hyphomicrobiaceae bacterium]
MSSSATAAVPREELSEALISGATYDPVIDDVHAMPLASEQEILDSLDATLARSPAARSLWVFGYGSLMWRPELDYIEKHVGTLAGFSRSFCLWQWRYRGSRERPGLMLALDEGVRCDGVLYRLEGAEIRAQLVRLWRREMTGMGYEPRWVDVESAEGPIRALTFHANRSGHRYAGRLPLQTIAAHIATACGQSGPNASYLLETWRSCREAGIDDAYVEELQYLVAGQLRARQVR